MLVVAHSHNKKRYHSYTQMNELERRRQMIPTDLLQHTLIRNS